MGSLADSAGAHGGQRHARIIGGRYRLDRLLGEGDSAQVWRAFDLTLERFVAVKVARRGRDLAPDRVEVILAEARRLAQLQHPGIAAVHDVARHGSTCYTVTDLIDGNDLGWLLQSGPVSLPVALRVTAEVAEALHYAHQQGFVHRNLKPASVLLDRGGRVLLTDFSGDELPGPGTEGIDVPYKSPEQLGGDGQRIDRRADVYSLGVLLYELLTGRRPFGCESPADLREQIIRWEPRRPRSLNPAIPRGVERICLRCLAKSPSERYATAQELASALRPYLAPQCLGSGKKTLLLALSGLILAVAVYAGYRSTTPNLQTADARNAEVDKGMVRFWSKDYRTALSHFDAALAYKKTFTVLCVKAESHLALGQYDEALACCEEVLETVPNCSMAHYVKGLVYRNTNHPAAALSSFELAAKYGESRAGMEIVILEESAAQRK